MTIDFYLSRFAKADSQAVISISFTILTLFLNLVSQVFCIKRKGKITTGFSQSFQMLIFKQQVLLADFPCRNQLEASLFTIKNCCLLMNLSVFRFPCAIPSNPSANSINGLIFVKLNGTNGHIKNPSSIWKQETNRSTVDSTRLRLQVLDNLHCRNFRCTRYGTTRKE
ncbi:Uncharacterised protein [Streptococcus pneumoniae]|nr:Uncharacterised protein [Streptococcus pneumoniae]CNA40266.1 Uncharacterised protein [Streptococcus pneumoniae]